MRFSLSKASHAACVGLGGAAIAKALEGGRAELAVGLAVVTVASLVS